MVRQSLSLEILHGDEDFSRVFTNVIDRANAWVIQCRGGAGLSPKPRELVSVICDRFGEKLQCYVAPPVYVFSFVGYSHASASNFADHPVTIGPRVGTRRPPAGMVRALRRY